MTSSKRDCRTCCSGQVPPVAAPSSSRNLQEGTSNRDCRTCCAGQLSPGSSFRMPQSSNMPIPTSSPSSMSGGTCPYSESQLGVNAGFSRGGIPRTSGVMSSKTISNFGPELSCKACCAGTGSQQVFPKPQLQRMQPRPPPTSCAYSEFGCNASMPRVQFSGGQFPQGPNRRSPSPLLTPPPLGSRAQPGTPSPLPFDFSLGLSSHGSSLERMVEEELKMNASMSPGSPVKAKGSRITSASPPVIMTAEGPVQGSHQLLIERTVNRLPEMEIINRRLAGIKVQDCGACASQIEIDMQKITPGGLNARRRGDSAVPLREIVSVTNSLTVGPGIRAKTSKTLYEYTKPADGAGGVDPAQVLEMIEEESKEVDKMKRLQPPELKGAAIEDYGLKKRLQKMKLNRESVRRLESTVVNPPPNADEPQEELQPELMAAIMHTEEHGLTMDSAPANVYNYLFPETKDDIVIKISPVAPSPLSNIVVPVEVPPTFHTSSVTPEMQYVAANTRCSQGVLPVDNIYTKSVLKPGAAPKFNNTAVKGKKVRKSKEHYPLLISEEPPWGVRDLQPLITLVGASPSNTMAGQDISEAQPTSIYRNELENSLEYQLVPEAPRHISRVQLRGTQKPSWFPGYVIALPDTIKLARSPSEVLPAAWQAVQPDIFADDSFLVVG